MCSRFAKFFSMVAVVGSLVSACDSGPEGGKDDLVLRNVTVVSPERDQPLDAAWVAVRGGRIHAVGEGDPDLDNSWERATVVDGGGRYLTPGLIDSHVHLAAVPGLPFPTPGNLQSAADAYEGQLPRSYLYFGFTTVIDLNVIDRAFLDRVKAAPVHPDVYDCGGGLVIANGYPMAFLPPESRFPPFPNFIYDPRQADAIPEEYAPEDHSPAAVVDRVAANGGICVKTYWETGFGPLSDLPTPTKLMMSEVIREAQGRNLVVTMHANSLAAHQFATEVGVDVVVHGLWNAPPGPEDRASLAAPVIAALDAIVSRDMGYMPTMQVLEGMSLMFEPDFLDDPALAAVVPRSLIDWYRTSNGRWFVEELRTEFGGQDDAAIRAVYASGDGPFATSRATVSYLAARDARFLFGSDTPSSPTYGNPPGYNGYLEMQNLVNAGVSLRQLLVAATIANAKAFKLEDRYGTVEPGKVANLLLLNENPLESVEAWNSIETVVLHGKPIERASLSAIAPVSKAPGEGIAGPPGGEYSVD